MANIVVSAVNDTLIEQSTQTFAGQALSALSTATQSPAPSGSQTIEVVDNDSYAVSIVGGTTSVTEGALVGQNVQVTLGLTANGAAGGTLEVGVTANLPGNADYSSTAASFSAGAGDNAMANIVVSAVNDTLVEAATESFAGQAVSATSVATQSPVASGSRTIEVVEDDRATIALQTTSSAAGEAAGTQNVTAVLTITATGTGTPQLDRVVSVTVSDAGGGTATGGGTDYTATTKTLTFGIGSVNGATQTTSGLLSIVDDLLLEGGETINLTLGGLSDGTAGRVTLVAPTSHTATITDNESATLAIASTSSVTEQGGPQSVGVVTLTVSGTGSGTAAMGKGIIVTADVADLSNGTAFGGGTDYAAFATQTVTFNGGVSDGTVLSGATRNAALTPTNDTLVEGSETVNLNLQNLVKPATVTAILGSITNNTTTITDNDTATLSIEATKTVTEQGGAQTITVTLTTTDGGTGTATLAPGVSLTADVDDLLTGTATSGILNDYTAFVTQTVTFGPGSGNAAIRTVTLTPTNDAVVEVPDETVKLKLQNLNTTLNGQASLGIAYSTVTISDNDTTSTLTVSSPKQYSDLATFTATLSPAVVQGSAPATSVTFYVGTQNMGTATLVSGGGVLTGTLTVPLLETVAGQMAPGARTVTAVFGGISANATVTSPTPATLNITQENANVTYTGQTFVTTLNATTTTVVVPLEAVIRDITAVNSGSDPNAGAILNATVTFKVFDAFSGSLLATISNPTIGLIGSDTKVALAQASYTVSLGNANAAIYRVETIVGGYYTADATASEALITVAKPIDYTINGGGYVIAGSSDGTYKADATSKMNFGINIGYNKSMTNVQGKVNAIFRHTEAGVVHTYQIKSNASGALSVDATTGVATFTAKANLTDITNAASPLPITGNFDMTLRVDDNGEPGTGSNSKGNDQFSLRLLNGTALVFASSWNGTQAALQTLDGGNIQVRPYSETLISFTNGTQGDQTLSEGMSGNKTMTFTVKLSQASTQTVKVNYTTADNSPSIGAATAGLDYVAASGTLTFAPGALTQTITVNVVGDTLYEPDETFFVNLSNPVGAGIQDPTAIGLITNDDAGPAPLHALGEAITSAGDTNDLSLDAVQPVLTAAIDYWRAQGADPLWLRSLDGLQVQIADLAGTTVGEASQGLIVLDHDAAGYGWSTALAEPLSGRVDLLSTLTHEVGHLLGLDHDVMGESLAVGVRVLPTSGQEFVYALQTADSTVASLPGQLGLPRALPVVADPVTAFASDQRTGPRAWVHDDKSASSRALDTTTVSQIDWTLGRSEARAKFDITPSSKRWIGDFVNHLGASAEQRNPNLGLKISLATAMPLSKGPNIL